MPARLAISKASSRTDIFPWKLPSFGLSGLLPPRLPVTGLTGAMHYRQNVNKIIFYRIKHRIRKDTNKASSDIPFEDPNGQRQGDTHYWDVWHGRKPFTAYRNQYPRFMSEFGFQALPPLATIRTYSTIRRFHRARCRQRDRGAAAA